MNRFPVRLRNVCLSRWRENAEEMLGEFRLSPSVDEFFSVSFFFACQEQPRRVFVSTVWWEKTKQSAHNARRSLVAYFALCRKRWTKQQPEVTAWDTLTPPKGLCSHEGTQRKTDWRNIFFLGNMSLVSEFLALTPSGMPPDGVIMQEKLALQSMSWRRRQENEKAMVFSREINRLCSIWMKIHVWGKNNFQPLMQPKRKKNSSRHVPFLVLTLKVSFSCFTFQLLFDPFTLQWHEFHSFIFSRSKFVLDT